MADGTTTNLSLTKPEVGASSDTWGTKINADLDTIDGLFDAGPYLKVAKGGTGAGTAAAAATNLGLGTGNTPQFTGIEVGHATDTTLTRSSAGVIAVEGVTVPLNSITSTHTAQQIELGHASDTTLSRSSAGVLAVEGVTVPLNSITNTHTAQQIELGHASDTTLSRSSAGILAVEGVTVPLNSTTNTHTAQKIELGHASDTTLARASAGVLSVEGNHVPSPASQAQGDVLYHNGTTWARLAAGVSGQFLKTLGAGANPAWADATGGGLTLLSTLTTTSGTTHSVTSIDTSYRALYIEIDGVSFTGSATLSIGLSQNNGSTYSATAVSAATGSGANSVIGSVWVDAIQNAVGTTLVKPSTTANNTVFTTVASVGKGPINAIQFTGGTFDAGTIRVYGLK